MLNPSCNIKLQQFYIHQEKKSQWWKTKKNFKIRQAKYRSKHLLELLFEIRIRNARQKLLRINEKRNKQKKINPKWKRARLELFRGKNFTQQKMKKNWTFTSSSSNPCFDENFLFLLSSAVSSAVSFLASFLRNKLWFINHFEGIEEILDRIYFGLGT